MKKALSLFISAILVLSLTIGAVSANAALGDKIDLSSLVSSLSNLSTSTSEARSDVNFVVAPARSGDVEKSVSGNTVTLTAKPNEGYKFVAWYKNLQDITDEKPYSTEATINVKLISGTVQYFYALFESTETTPSVSITTPSISIPDTSAPITAPSISIPDITITKPDVNLPSNIISTRATAPTASGSQVKTTTTTAVTADAARVERASQLMDNLNKTLSKANEPSTTKASSTSTTKAASKSKSNKPKKTSISKIKAQKKGFKVTWKKVSNAKGYQVKYSTSKKFTKKTSKTATVKKATTTSKTVKKLKKKKTYYVKVRSYKTVNAKKVYSDWSKVKKVKTK
ncbi:MAG: hypothetical protein PUE60_01160 [Eubacteriales bacterium]|nr:hypothetical protein [Eubacteriales bacterium]